LGLKNCWSKITDFVTVQGDHTEYLVKMAVVKLPANDHVLISHYQLYSHTCWIPVKVYHSLYKQWHVDTCGRLENYIFVFDWPTWWTWAELTWWLHLCVLKDYLTNPVGIWNFVDVKKGVYLSFELITVNIIINAVNHKYIDRPSWSNLQIHNSGFN